MRTAVFSLLALIGFAANSVICRLALGRHLIDAASFTSVRLLSGALALGLLHRLLAPNESRRPAGSWRAALLLFAYAAPFSFAYVTLATGTGALLLFSAVQVTMILAVLFRRHRLQPLEWAGLAVAFAGFLYLVLPGVSAPPVAGSLLMTIAGVAWGGYTLLGQQTKNPVADTAGNFARTLPLLTLLVPFSYLAGHASTPGILLAVLSGAVTSGVGYTLWYFALRGLTATQAATIQLFAPVLAAFGGIFLLGETLTLRLTLAGALVLGGIALVVRGRKLSAKEAA